MAFSITQQPNPSQSLKIGDSFQIQVKTAGADVTAWPMFKDGALFIPVAGELIVTHTPGPVWLHSFTYTHLVTSSSDAGTYKFSLSHDATVTDTNDALLMISTPILDRVEKKIATLVGGMRKTDGYNFDWGLVNEQDESIPDSTGNVNFPRCVIDPTDMVADKENNVDTLAGVGSLDYTNEVVFTLLVKGELPTFDTNPLFAARSLLRKAHDDLKKLFGIHLNLDSECDNIMYAGSQIESLVNNDVQRPAQLRTFWKVVYSQDRRTPTQYASS